MDKITLKMFFRFSIIIIILVVQISFAKKNRTNIWNCNNLCLFAFNGICEDGGPNSSSLICIYGSDCHDCGVRAPYTERPTLQKTNRPTVFKYETWQPTQKPSYSPTISYIPNCRMIKKKYRCKTRYCYWHKRKCHQISSG